MKHFKLCLVTLLCMASLVCHAVTIKVGGSTTLNGPTPGSSRGALYTWSPTYSAYVGLMPSSSGSTCTVTGEKAGSVTISCTVKWQTYDSTTKSYVYADSNKKTQTYSVTVQAADITTPTSISLNYTSISLEVGRTKQLSATVSPSGASQSVTWSVVSGSGVASVSSSGLVTANATGTATIRATSSAKSSVYKDCTVTVTQPTSPTSISLNYTSISLTEGGTKQLSASVSPSGASQSVTWSVVSGSSVVSVSSSGLVTANATGTATVRATSTANSSVYKNCTVTVTAATLDPGTWSGNTLTIGGSATNSVNDVPYGNYYKYSTVQMLYTPTEIGKSGTINSIAFKVASSSSFATSEVKVYLGHKSSKFSSASNYVSSSNLTLVYSGAPTLGSTTGWETLTFNQGTFTYNGTDNLVVVVAMKSSNYNTTLYYNCYTGNGYVLSRGNDNIANYGDVTNTSYDYSQSTNRPSIKIGFTSSQGTSTTDIAINATNFPDENFRNYLLSQSYGQDGVLTESEINGITSISVSNKQIKSLKGIEYFTALTELVCYSNQLTELDISKNIALTKLYCYSNQLTALDLSKNTRLTILNCQVNQLTTLDLLKNTSLEILLCSFNQLTALDLSKNTVLTSLDCQINQLTALDLSKNTELTSLHCNNNQLTAFDLSKNTKLTWLFCDSNQLTTLDLSKNTVLTSLNCQINQLTALDLSKNTELTSLNCYRNQLTTLDLSKNTKLAWLDCYSNLLTALYLSNNTELTWLNCYRNKISGQNMDILIASLPQNNNTNYAYTFHVIDNSEGDEENVCTKSQVAAVKAKGWLPEYCTSDSGWIEYEGSEEEGTPFEDGDIFTANTVEGVEMTFKVISAANKTCQVGKGSWSAAISSDWTGAITIPDKVNGLTVTSIGEYAFYYCPITSITIPNSVTSIGNNAFASSDLKSIIIPNSVTSIGNNAFASSDLTSIIIPNSVTSIGDNIFQYCYYLSNITLSNTLSSIGKFAFYNCKALENITIPNSVTAIRNNAFYGCSQLTNITIPNSVTSIGNSAFELCHGLTSVTIPSSLTYIGEKALSGCSALTNIVVESGNTAYDSRNNCNAIIEKATNTLIVGCQNSAIPNTVTTIGDYAFRGCSNLASITIPNSVTAIGDYAFHNCSNLASITIPNSVTAIGDNAFEGCSNLASITIPNSVTAIGERAFSECKSLTSLGIPNSVTSIGNYAFSSCSSLTSIVVESENTAYDSRNNCNAIIEKTTNTLIVGCQNSTIPNTVTAIGDKAFEYCRNLTNISIPNSVTSIGNDAFYNCTGLASISIPNSVTAIGNSAFYGCGKLIGVISENEEPFAIGGVFSSYSIKQQNAILYVPAGTIEKYEALEGWSDFTKITAIPNVGDTFTANTAEGVEMTFLVTNATDKICSVYSIPSNTTGFVTIPNYANIYKVTSINNSAFQNITGVTNIIIPNSVTSIGNNAFENCTGLASISIPNSVISIGNNALFGCTALTSIVSLIKDPFIVDANVFQYAGNNGNQTLNATLYIPKGTKSKYDNAQGWNQFANIISNVFTVDYGDEINVTFMVTDETDKTCQIGTGFAPAIDDEMSDYNRFPIPLTVNGYDVTAIADNAFANCKKLYTSYISNNIKSIGENAFKGCGNLDIYSYIEEPFTIPESAFPNSSYLTIPYGTKSKYQETAGWNIFRYVYDETGIIDGIRYHINGAHPDKGQPYTAWVESAIWNPYENNVIIPDTLSIGDEKFAVKGIDDGAFEGSLITMVSIPQSVTSIDSYAFANCTQLRHVYSAITDPSSCNISSYAFGNLSSDATLYVPTDTKTLYENAPVWNKFTNIVEIEQGGNIDESNTVNVDGIYYELSDGQSFNNAIGVELLPADQNVAVVVADPNSQYNGDVVIPSSIIHDETTYSVVGITKCAFAEYKEEYQHNLRSVVIPNSVLIIGEEAFVESTTLQRVEIPNSVICIVNDAFGDCESLNEVVSYIEEPFEIPTSVFRNIASDAVLYVPAGAKALYEATAGWNVIANIVEMKPAGLQDGDIFTEADITYQVISASEKTARLKRGADVSGIVNIPSEVNGFTVTAIGKAAFRELRNITAVTIPNSVVTMDRSVFDDCSNLTSVSIPESVTSIGERLFTGCKEITSVTVASDNPVYDSRNNCNAIIETATNTLMVGCIASVIPESVVTIGTRAFEDIRGMVGVDIPEGVTSIEDMAFIDCPDLKEVSLPSTLTSISMDAFSECPSITKVTSLITTPFAIDKWTFGIEDTNYADYFNPVVYNTATLYVPAGASALYQATDGWKQFKNIVEMEIDLPDTDISEMENVIYIEEAEAIPDGNRTTIFVKMKNSFVASGFGFNIYLPEGCTFDLKDDGTPFVERYRERTKNIEHFDPVIEADGSLRLDAYTTKGDTISGNDSIVALVRINVAEGTAIGNYPLVLKNWTIADNLGSDWTTNNQLKYTLSVVPIQRGNANGDDLPGIQPGDFITLGNYILKLPYRNLNRTAADANGDGSIDVSDLTATSNLKKYGTVYRPKNVTSRKFKEEETREAE